MQPPPRSRIGFAAALLLIAVLAMQSGCVQYHADIEQRFADNGTAFLTVHENMRIDESMTSEYVATLQNSSNSRLGSRLVSGIVAYYNNGSYAKDLCRRAVGTACQVSPSGEVVWNTTLQPNGRFYAHSSHTDWLVMEMVSDYRIERVPLLHFQAYGSNTPAETAKMEWEGLRKYLQSYLAADMQQDSGIRQEAEWMLAEDGPLKKAIDRYAPLRASEQILDFTSGQIRARSFEGQNQSSAVPKLYVITLSYTADFPSPVTSASIGDTPLDAEGGRRLKLTLDENQHPAKGPIVVTTKKTLSPIGIYTWIIPIIGIAFTLMREIFLGSKKIWKEDES